jgi:inosine/xanthosine triphosphate pyrophosphatase family protein
MKLVLASHNQGKLQELAAILEPAVPGLELVSYNGPEPIEDGTSGVRVVGQRRADLVAGDDSVVVAIEPFEESIPSTVTNGTRPSGSAASIQ